MIISCSRRTDIPAFYGEWLIRRVREGWCEVQNPYRPSQRSTVSLSPEDVDCFVFWTRAPGSLVPHLAELRERGHRWYFLYTLMDYPPGLETHQPPLERRVDLLRAAAAQGEVGSVIWRYDPIILSSRTPVEYHVQTFGRLAAMLSGTVHRVIVSFLDVYAKVAWQVEALGREGTRVAPQQEVRAALPSLLPQLVSTARAEGMEITSCAEEPEVEAYGVAPGKCVDDELICRLHGIAVPGGKDPGQRDACRCVRSRDIGAYDTCVFGCRYCYATTSRDKALENSRRHTPDSPSLLPPPRPDQG